MRTDIRLHDEEGRPLYRISCLQANDMISSGQAEECYSIERRYLGIKLIDRRAKHEESSASLSSSASITAREMLANAGITKAHGKAHDNTVRAARYKVNFWPHIRDEKAPLASCFANA